MNLEKFQMILRDQTQAIEDRPMENRKTINATVEELTLATGMIIAGSTPWIRPYQVSKE